MTIDGILNIDKPEGITSFSVIARLRKLTGIKRIGHAGTLDPLASGVLPVCFGRATRVIRFLMDARKTYRAEIELGVNTDTFDREGKILERCDPSQVTEDDIHKALDPFKGVIEQTPPSYSALKYHGKRYYEMARAGEQIPIKPRKIEIFRLDLLSWEIPLLKIEVECSKGTYIRSLANDVGKVLTCGGYLKNLVRTMYGPYDIEGSHELTEIKDAVKDDTFEDLLEPIDGPLVNLDAVLLDVQEESDVRSGRSIRVDNIATIHGHYCRAYSRAGEFIAVLEFVPESNLWHPDVVVAVTEKAKECGCANRPVGCCGCQGCQRV